MPVGPDILRHERRRPALLGAVVLISLVLAGLLIALIVGAVTGDPIVTLPETSGKMERSVQTFALPPAAAPTSDPTALKPISASDAEAANNAIPLSATPNPAARAFLGNMRDADNWHRSVACLTAAAYYEAASEGQAGMSAVAQVVLNRVRHPAFPKSVCGVVFEGAERHTGCQFTFTCDGALARPPSPALWARARMVALAELGGAVFAPVGLATHYHTRWVLPYWAETLQKNAVIGNHIFYRWGQGWGMPNAFRGHYASVEPDLPWLAALPNEGAPDGEREDASADGSGATGHQGAVPLNARQMIGTVAPVVHLTAPRPVAAQERWMLGGAAPSSKGAVSPAVVAPPKLSAVNGKTAPTASGQ